MSEHNSALRHPEHEEFCNYNTFEHMNPDVWCNCGVGDPRPKLDLYYDDRVPIKYRGPIRESAARLCDGQVTLGYFVEQVRNAVLDEIEREITANRAQGIKWEPPVDPKIERWYAEGYDRGLRDVDSIIEDMRRG